MAQAIIESQMRIYGLISRALENLNKLGRDNITRGAVQSRLNLLDSNWSKFEQGNTDLYSRELSSADGGHAYFTEDVFSACEEAFLTAKAAFLDKLEDFAAQRSSGISSTRSGAATSTSSTHHASLPKIELPTFSGKYSEWSAFCDLFQSMVGDNSDLRPVTKLHYLKTHLTGEAARSLSRNPTTDDNYERA